MSVDVAAAGRGLRRTLLVLALLAGVLAMHGITANHAAMTSMASMSHPAAGSAASSHTDAEQAMAAMPAALAGTSLLLEHTHLGEALDAQPMGAMTGACVAVLVTSLLLALLLTLARRRVWTVAPVHLVRRGAITAGAPRPGATGRPSLFELCVLRT